MRDGNKQPSFENVSLLLRIPYRSKLKYDPTYPPFFPSNPPYVPHNNGSSRHVFSLNDRLTRVNVAHVCMGMGPFSGAWESYQGPHPLNRILFPPLPLSTAKSFSVRGQPTILRLTLHLSANLYSNQWCWVCSILWNISCE